MPREVKIEVRKELSDGTEITLREWKFPYTTIFQSVNRGTSTEWRIRPSGLRYLPRAYWRRRLTDTVRIEGLMPITHAYGVVELLEDGSYERREGLRNIVTYLQAFPSQAIRENRWLRIKGLQDYDIPYDDERAWFQTQPSPITSTKVEAKWAVERPLRIMSRSRDSFVQDGRWNPDNPTEWQYKWRDPAQAGPKYSATKPSASYEPVMTTLCRFTLDLRRI